MKKNFMRIFVGLIVLLLSFNAQAQDATQKAKTILDALKSKYENTDNLSLDFKLNTKFPESEVISQKGNLKRQGNKINLKLGAFNVISDGETLWNYKKESNEVEINNAPTEGESMGVISPSKLLSMYQNNKVFYALTDTFKGKKGRTVSQIELKTNDDMDDFFKYKILIDKARNEINEIIAFNRDGSRYSFVIDKTDIKTKLASSTFKFDISKYEGIQVEDLRF